MTAPPRSESQRMNWKRRLEHAFAPNTPDPDVLEELAQHAAAAYASARAEGCDPAEAERRVDLQIAAWAANPDLLQPPSEARTRRRAACRPGARRLTAIAQDARYAWRLLRRQPAYAALVVTTMALGIAATTVVGSVAYGVLLKPLPWADAPRLVRLFETRQGSTRRFRPMMTNVTYARGATRSRTLDAIGAWSQQRVALAGHGRSASGSPSPSVTPTLLDDAARRRRRSDVHSRTTTTTRRDRRTIILSYGFWQQRFGGRPDALGQTLRLDATQLHDRRRDAGVVCVSRSRHARLGAVLRRAGDHAGQDGFYDLDVPGDRTPATGRDGRSRPPPKAPRADAQLRDPGVGVDGGVRQQRTGGSHRRAAAAGADRRREAGDPHPACRRGAAAGDRDRQRREPAARARDDDGGASSRSAPALGAARGRLVRQTLVENLLLGLLGGAAGLVLAAVMHRALPAVLPANFPRLDDLAFDWRIQAFAIAVSLAAGTWLRAAARAAAWRGTSSSRRSSRTRWRRRAAACARGRRACAHAIMAGAGRRSRASCWSARSSSSAASSALMHANVGYDAASVLTRASRVPRRRDPPAHAAGWKCSS